uniref:Uncharacterized protein n=1 Tax=Chenopodium quinoa TaxID=63459 RepID=A0A803LQ19_CHEQI
MHKTLKAQLRETLSKVSSRISLTCDMWTSCQTEGYLCLTAHYVDNNWKLISTVLNFSHIDSPHTRKTMYAAVLSMLQDWGTDDKIFCFTLDNASNVEATLRVSDLHLKLEKLYKLYALTGTSSTLNNNTDMAHASHSRASISSTSAGNHKRKFDYFAEYDDKEASSSFDERSILDVYIEDPKLDWKAELDILAFWKENEHRYKGLLIWLEIFWPCP